MLDLLDNGFVVYSYLKERKKKKKNKYMNKLMYSWVIWTLKFWINQFNFEEIADKSIGFLKEKKIYIYIFMTREKWI